MPPNVNRLKKYFFFDFVEVVNSVSKPLT